VEVPPGPPVQAPLVAEIYGIDDEGQIRAAQRVRGVFENTADVVDVDDSVEAPQPQLILHVDRDKAALLGVSQQDVAAAVATAVGGEDVSYLHGANAKYPVPIRIKLPVADKADLRFLLNLKVRGAKGAMVPLSELLTVVHGHRGHAIYHKDLLPVVFVTGDMAGKLDSPLYGMFSILSQLNKTPLEGGETLNQYLLKPPDDPYRYSVKWDGEWQVTYETFRDMGIAYAVGLVLIYLLVVAQFRSYLVPLIIMAPIPLTIIGVMPGHAVLNLFMDAKFTATSMIGMIALAGIIVRNSILLVDFINAELEQGTTFADAVIRSSAVRAKPIVLTAVAAMLGAFFILDDPIFSGLAISLIFGVLVSTVLTLVIIPVLYYALMRNKLRHDNRAAAN
jgi:multidrug efflux pump subunit AcrB